MFMLLKALIVWIIVGYVVMAVVVATHTRKAKDDGYSAKDYWEEKLPETITEWGVKRTAFEYAKCLLLWPYYVLNFVQKANDGTLYGWYSRK